MLSAWMGTSGTIAMNSEHHQGIRTLGAGLNAVAVAPDGLVEVPSSRLVGVQWHPEILWPNDQHARMLLRGFVRVCASGAPAAVPA